MKRFVIAAALAGCAAGTGIAVWLGRAHIAESLVIAATITALLSLRSARIVMETAPLAHRLVAGGLLFLFLSGHIATVSARIFPFVAWRMFPGMRDVVNPRYYVIEAITSAGERLRISPERVWPPLRDFRFTGSYQMIADNRSHLDGVNRDLLLALAREYRRQHRDADLVRVEVFENTISLAARDRRLLATHQFIYGVNLE